MTVDLEVIARRSGSDLSSLKLALPLIEQGFEPPFLARYRRDELGGLSEATLWMLQQAVRGERSLSVRREELTKVWQRTRLADASLQKAIRDAKNKAAINRVARRLKNEPSDPNATIAPEVWVASRILNPQPGDSGDVASLATAVDQGEHLEKITQSLDRALAKRIADHPQIQAAAVRWLNANASIRFIEVSDPNLESRTERLAPAADAASERPETEPGANWPSPEQLDAATAPTKKQKQKADAASPAAASDQATAPEQATAQVGEATEPNADAAAQDAAAPSADAAAPSADAAAPSAESTPTSDASRTESLPPTPATTETPADATATADATAPADASTTATAGDSAPAAAASDTAAPPASSAAEPPPAGEPAAEAAPSATAESAAVQAPAAGKKKGKAKSIVKQTKVLKKLSPRQRRRRWLIGILQPLVGKQLPIKNLSAFQTLVLSRALRANLVRCQFVYDANQLIAQLRKTAANLNPAFADHLSEVVTEHEAAIRESTESVWWDELQDAATGRLVDLTAANLDMQLHRSPIEAKTILALDAVGPRTSPISIVSGDGRLLHTEDIASQLDNELRTASVTRMGELIHRFGVDLIAISNGPARRAAMIILGELIAQSPADTIRWTVAERSGADAYASSEVADREMRVTPRRFRAAAWLAFSLLKPAWALAKVDPLKLRLSAAQRELPEELLGPPLRDVMSSAVSRGGLDVNSAPVDSLLQLPGVTRKVAEAIDRHRRQSLFTSRDELLTLPEWPDEAHSRQAIGFLRVFGSDESLDATVIHPEDYSLARKLAKALNLELPPAAPPGYQPPNFDDAKAGAAEGDAATQLPAATDQAAATAGSDAESPSSFAAELLLDQAAAPSEETATASAEAAASSADAPAATGEEPSPPDAAGSADAAQAETAAQPGDVAAQAEAAAPDAAATEAPAEDAPTAKAAATEAPQAEPAAEAAPEVNVRQPLPDPAAINKCIREWQIGASRAHRLVHALCDPFGEEAVSDSGPATAVMTQLPKASSLRPGDAVAGVVASVAPFGAFVEISPELTGLIRVSRLAVEYVEEIHDFIQVGDVVTAWVTEIDSRRRLQLSAISPEREQALRQQRQEQREQRGQRRGGSRPGGEAGRGGAGQGGAGQGRAGQGGPGRQGQSTARPTGGAGRGGRGAPAGGRGDARRGGRDESRRDRGRDRGGRREEPISYTTRVPKNEPPAPPISAAMAEGKEPLRSFSDLLQFLKKDAPAAPKQVKPKDAAKAEAAKTDAEKPQDAAPAQPTSDAAPPTAAQPAPQGSGGTSEPPAAAPNAPSNPSAPSATGSSGDAAQSGDQAANVVRPPSSATPPADRDEPTAANHKPA